MTITKWISMLNERRVNSEHEWQLKDACLALAREVEAARTLEDLRRHRHKTLGLVCADPGEFNEAIVAYKAAIRHTNATLGIEEGGKE